MNRVLLICKKGSEGRGRPPASAEGPPLPPRNKERSVVMPPSGEVGGAAGGAASTAGTTIKAEAPAPRFAAGRARLPMMGGNADDDDDDDDFGEPLVDAREQALQGEKEGGA